MNIGDEKKIIRNRIKKLREQISDIQKLAFSKTIFDEIEQLDTFKKAQIIFLYWSFNNEVLTHDFILKWSNSKKFLLPVAHLNELELKYFTDKDSMKRSLIMNLQEPTGKPFTDFDKIDLAIVPGVAFDKNNNRLGYGKGYYDKLLCGLDVYKIGICFNFQLLDEIPHNNNDIRMDLVISN